MENPITAPNWSESEASRNDRTIQTYMRVSNAEQMPTQSLASPVQIPRSTAASFTRHIDSAQNSQSTPQIPSGAVLQTPAPLAGAGITPPSTPGAVLSTQTPSDKAKDNAAGHQLQKADRLAQTDNSAIVGNKIVEGSAKQTDFSCPTRCQPDIANTNHEAGREPGMPRKYQVQKGMGLSAPTSINTPSFLDGAGFRINEISDMKNGGGGESTGPTNQGATTGDGTAGAATSTTAGAATGAKGGAAKL